MTGKIPPRARVSQPGMIVVGAIYLFYIAVVIRTLTNPNIRSHLLTYLVLEGLYLILFTIMLWHPVSKPLWQHLYFIFQALLVLALVLLRPRFDFIVILYVILSLQAVLIFSNHVRWIWVTILTLLTGVPLVVTLGALLGLSLALMPITIGLVFAAYAAVTQEIETGLRNRQALLTDLQAANQQLTASADRVEELSAIQERNRLARELHDSVSQTIFSISLHTRATQIILEREPDRLQSQLEQLQVLTHNALEEMRSLIADLRPPENESTDRIKT